MSGTKHERTYMFYMCSAIPEDSREASVIGGEIRLSGSRMIRHGVAGLGGGRVRRADDQAVGRGERREHRAVLDGRRASRPAGRSAPAASVRAEVVLAAVVGRQVGAEHRRLARVGRRRARGARRSAASGTGSRRRGSRPDCRAGRAPASAPSRPNISGLPGRMAIFQKSSAMPSSVERLLDEVVVADRGAAERDEDVGGKRERRVDRRADRGACRRGRCRGRCGSPPASATKAAMPSALEATIWSGPGVAPGGTSSSPVAMIATRGRRRTGTVGVVHRGGERDLAHAEPRGRRRAGRRLRGNRGRPGGCCGPARPVLGDDDRRRRASAFSWMRTASAPVGHRRAGEDADRLAGADRAGEAVAGGATCRRPVSRAGTFAASAARTA